MRNPAEFPKPRLTSAFGTRETSPAKTTPLIQNRFFP